MPCQLSLHPRLWLLLCIAALFPSIAAAEKIEPDKNDAKENYAATDPAKVDRDFPYQGEFYGQLWGDLEHRTAWNVALQVVANGGGKFDAILFSGGFPGMGWNGLEPIRLTGTFSDDEVHLQGEGYIIVVTDRYADVYVSNYIPLGQIAKITRVSTTDGALPPWGATVLFNGYDAAHFVNGRISRDGYLVQGTDIKELYRDYTLHVEFLLPYMPYARGQGRSNSGVYLQSRYEVQILDSYGLAGENNECGGLYKFRRPDFNMCYPPLTWQTYDIVFTSPTFADDGTKTANGQITVYHNGVAIHHNVDLERKTGGGAEESLELLPIKLQDHHNPVRFRNIWIIDDAKPTIDPYPHYARPDAPFQPWGVNLSRGYNPIQRGYPFGTN